MYVKYFDNEHGPTQYFLRIQDVQHVNVGGVLTALIGMHSISLVRLT